jgi:hypothetical protein
LNAQQLNLKRSALAASAVSMVARGGELNRIHAYNSQNKFASAAVKIIAIGNTDCPHI